jgi:hypothetical protein
MKGVGAMRDKILVEFDMPAGSQDVIDELEFIASCEGLNVQFFGGKLIEDAINRMWPDIKAKAAKTLADPDAPRSVRAMAERIAAGEFDLPDDREG